MVKLPFGGLLPFSSDYSGSAAFLFALHTVMSMHDAAGCTGNPMGYDDPRNYGPRQGAVSSGLCRFDGILGGAERQRLKKLRGSEKE